jgi:hypothetical protein
MAFPKKNFVNTISKKESCLLKTILKPELLAHPGHCQLGERGTLDSRLPFGNKAKARPKVGESCELLGFERQPFEARFSRRCFSPQSSRSTNQMNRANVIEHQIQSNQSGKTWIHACGLPKGVSQS